MVQIKAKHKLFYYDSYLIYANIIFVIFEFLLLDYLQFLYDVQYNSISKLNCFLVFSSEVIILYEHSVPFNIFATNLNLHKIVYIVLVFSSFLVAQVVEEIYFYYFLVLMEDLIQKILINLDYENYFIIFISFMSRLIFQQLHDLDIILLSKHCCFQ